jgi:hypothetical protein
MKIYQAKGMNAELRIKKNRSSFCILHSSFCLSSSGQASPKASHCGGQAMIEFTVALIAIMAVIVGMILLNKMICTHTDTMITARAEAGALALDLVCQNSLDTKFILDWEAGADRTRYTHDDEPVLDGTAGSLIGDIVAYADMEGVTFMPSNLFVQATSDYYPLLVKGEESVAVDLSVIPAAERLITGEPTISVESKAWLPWIGGGIY